MCAIAKASFGVASILAPFFRITITFVEFSGCVVKVFKESDKIGFHTLEWANE